jgi:hypothetical protein
MTPRPDMSEIDYEHDTGGNGFVAVLVIVGCCVILAGVAVLLLVSAGTRL